MFFRLMQSDNFFYLSLNFVLLTFFMYLGSLGDRLYGMACFFVC